MKPKTKFNPAFFIGLIAVTIAACSSQSPLLPSPAKALSTKEGVLKGAGCVHYKMDCPDDKAHIAMENDFVLAQPDGKHYFLPNVSRATKAEFANRAVRVSGELEEHSIWVDMLEVKTSGKFKTVWSAKEQEQPYKGGQ